MASIPAFMPPPGDYPHPVLPAQADAATLAEIEERFVTSIAGSSRRAMLFDGLKRWLQEAEPFGVSLTVWIDGSFVEGKTDPDDVDIWSFYDGNAVSAMPPARQAEFWSVTSAREATKPTFHCHTLGFGWFNHPAGHPLELLNEDVRMEALRTWGFTRPTDKATGTSYSDRYPKGFVVLTIGTDPPAIRTEGVWP